MPITTCRFQMSVIDEDILGVRTNPTSLDRDAVESQTEIAMANRT